MTEIKFGTDGWRAIVDKDFTASNIKKVIQAFCDWRKSLQDDQTIVYLGYDRRQKSKESAEIVASVLAANGFKVYLSSQFCPTPCVSWMVKKTEAFVGIMITASHNPWEWNGIKFKESYGGSASPEYTQNIEKKLVENGDKEALETSFEDALSQKKIEYFNPLEDYCKHLAQLINIEAIKKSPYKICVDPIHGAGSHYFKHLLSDRVTEIRGNEDLHFGGVNPEPIAKNLSVLIEKIKNDSFDLGLATDGDADRIGAVDENGNFVSPQIIFALLLKHYVEDKKLKGAVVKSVSTTQLINSLCDKYDLEVIETPIGFKHICKELIKKDSVMGGEESGGLSYSPHVHERDGILNGLMIAEMMAERGQKLSELTQDLFDEFGHYYFERNDLHLEKAKIEKVKKKLSSETINEINGLQVQSRNFSDGFKFTLENGSWLLIRASGTEPLIRLYAEASQEAEVKNLLLQAKQLIS